jgi:hypothetical protein
MLQWGVVSMALYGIALIHPWPLMIQAALTKMANVNAGAFIGYWIDRTLFSGFDQGFHTHPRRYSNESKAARLIARGIVVGACVLGLSTGVGA